MIYLDAQIRFLQALEVLRGPWLDPFWLFLNRLDNPNFYTLVVLVFWFGCSWKCGARLATLVTINGLVNTFVKRLLEWPRPFFCDPEIALIRTVSDFGFPSGGAQTSLLFGALVIYFWRSRWRWPVGVGYAALISLSRLVLGVHFPIDVLGGWVIGLAIFWAFIRFYEQIERFAKQRAEMAFGVSLALVAVACLALISFRLNFFFGSLLGLIIGFYLMAKFPLRVDLPHGLGKRICFVLYGIVSTGLIGFGLHALGLPGLLQAALLSVWVSYPAIPLGRRFT